MFVIAVSFRAHLLFMMKKKKNFRRWVAAVSNAGYMALSHADVDKMCTAGLTKVNMHDKVDIWSPWNHA